MASDEEVFQNIQALITQVLIAAQNAQNKEASEAATKQYQLWEQQHFPMWMTALAFELADDSKGDSPSRQVAGLAFRRNLDADTEETHKVVCERWLAVSSTARDHIKSKLTNVMSSTVTMYRHLAAQCIGQIAVLEIPDWIEVVDHLSEVMLSSKSDYLKEASLIALETISRSVNPDLLENYASKILTAIAQGMISPHYELQVVGTKALCSAINFSYKIFDRENDRRNLMVLILNASKSDNEAVRLAAFECLVQIVGPYYGYLDDYMNEIFAITLNCIRNDQKESVVLQAIEFWTTLSEEEVMMLEENERREDAGMELIAVASFVSGAAPTLCDPLCQCITREIDTDLGQWTVTSAASACLGAIATVLRKDVIPYVLPFVTQNIMSQEDGARASALLAFGAIMDGPETYDIKAMIVDALPVVLDYMSVESSVVKLTALWVLRRIAQFHAPALEKQAQLEPYLQALCVALGGDVSVAAFACEAIDKLASSVHEPSDTNPLNPYFEPLFHSLRLAIDRPDAYRENLRLCALEATRTLINIVPDHLLSLVEKMVSHFGSCLNTSMTAQSTGSDGNVDHELNDIQGELCGILATCAMRLGPGIGPVADNMMVLFFGLMRNSTSSSLHQECFMAISSVIRALQSDFAPYLPTYTEFLLYALHNIKDDDLCRQAVYGVTDLCLYLPEQIRPQCPTILHLMTENLKHPNLSPSLAPEIVASLSDVAHALGEEFVNYLPNVMEVFYRASEIAILNTDEISDPEQIDRVYTWRETILAAYSLTILSLQKEHKSQLKGSLQHIIDVIRHITLDSSRRVDSINRAVCGLIVDIATTYGHSVSQQLREFITFVQHVEQSAFSSIETKQSAQLAAESIEKY